MLHHLVATLPRPEHTVLFVGFQAAGTRGRLLVDGAKQVRIKGRDVPVVARIEKLDSMSAHADADEILRWLSGFSRPPEMTYLVHGEAAGRSSFAISASGSVRVKSSRRLSSGTRRPDSGSSTRRC